MEGGEAVFDSRVIVEYVDTLSPVGRLTTLVDESLDAVVLELTGSEAFVLSCLRALERFEIVEIARSGAVAMESGTAELRFGAQPQLEAGAR